jgi:2-dehydro-3-deoxy-D-gluconate 5-dehydrogenase
MADQLFDLHGKVALVTGGNGGIGLGIAMGLANAGAHIVVAARNAEKNRAAVEELKRTGVQTAAVVVDVQDESSVKSMVQEAAAAFGRLDILVNNAGISVANLPQKYSLEEWQRVIDTNLTSVFLCSREVHPHMVAAGGGKIINIGSMTSIFGHPMVASYSSSKGAVVQLTKSLSLAWAGDNIQVNAILPGWINTDLTAPIQKMPSYLGAISSRIPQGRWGEPKDLAGTAVFLAGRASDYVTGIALPVDGGYSCM